MQFLEFCFVPVVFKVVIRETFVIGKVNKLSFVIELVFVEIIVELGTYAFIFIALVLAIDELFELVEVEIIEVVFDVVVFVILVVVIDVGVEVIHVDPI